MANGRHLSKHYNHELLKLDIIADAYEGHVSIARGDISPNEFIAVGREIAQNLEVAFDSYIQGDTAIVRLNRGFPINVLPYSERGKEFLAEPGRMAVHQMWQNLFYGISLDR